MNKISPIHTLDVTAIILTKNEAIHIARCLENISQIAKKIYVVDCHSSDGTQDIARSLGAKVVEHDWPGNQAAQFNWALDNLPINTEWILRLDADEYLTDELIEELRNYVPNAQKEVTALVFPLGRAFMGKILKHGIVNGISMIRMFRRGKARYEDRIMDEHLQISDGKTYTCKNKFIDDNRMPLGYFIEKHNSYATREALLLIDAYFSHSNNSLLVGEYADSVQAKRAQKAKYANMPLFWRSFGYFIYRYIFKLGFLDGKEGFLWDFLQGWWYRTLVDAKVFEIKKKCGNDPVKIKHLLESEYGIKF